MMGFAPLYPSYVLPLPAAFEKREDDMLLSKRTLYRSAIALLGLAALAAAFGFGTVVAQQQTAATKVTSLMTKTLADVPGREVMMITLDIPPGGGSPPHRHPGAHNFGYVLEGAYRIKLDSGSETVLTKGQTFYEAPGQLHAVSRNASETEPAKVLVVVVNEAGKPLTVPEKP
jgi:quercetin dioxygenase-like cupin family protein